MNAKNYYQLYLKTRYMNYKTERVSAKWNIVTKRIKLKYINIRITSICEITKSIFTSVDCLIGDESSIIDYS